MLEPHNTILHVFPHLEYRQLFWLNFFFSNLIHKSVSHNVTETKFSHFYAGMYHELVK